MSFFKDLLFLIIRLLDTEHGILQVLNKCAEYTRRWLAEPAGSQQAGIPASVQPLVMLAGDSG